MHTGAVGAQRHRTVLECDRRCQRGHSHTERDDRVPFRGTAPVVAGSSIDIGVRHHTVWPQDREPDAVPGLHN